MDFYRLDEVPHTAGDVAYRYRVLPTVIVAVILGLLAVGLLASAVVGTVWGRLPVAAACVMGFSGSCLLLMARLASGTFPTLADRRVNWLLMRTPNGLIVKFRSHLNPHLPADDVVAARIDYGEIEWVRKTREKRLVRDADGEGPATTYKTFLDIRLRSADAPRLAEHVRAERAREAPWVKTWYGRSRTLHRHHPVRMAAPELLRISWEAAPRLSQALQALRHFVTVAPLHKEGADFHHVEALPRTEQEARIRVLAEEGDIFSAVRTAREAYGLSSTEAVKHVKALTAAPPPEDEAPPAPTSAALP